MIFKSTFSKHIQLGKKRKYINKRTIYLFLNNTKSPLLIVDLDYIAYLLTKKLNNSNCIFYKYKNENFLSLVKNNYSRIKQLEINKTFIAQSLEYLNTALKLSLPNKILLLKNTKEIKEPIRSDILQALEYLYSRLNIPIVSCEEFSISDYVYNLKLHDKALNTVIVTNSIRCWAVSYNKTNVSFIYFTSGIRGILFTHKFGLDFLSKFLQTDTLINKTGLDDLKYISLQYIYVLLLYIKFLYNKKDKEFYFDSSFFSDFYKSSGKGVEIINDAHKMLSYIFLTKPELLELFLFSSSEEFNINLNRLLKLTDFDLNICLKFKNFYNICGERIKLSLNFTVPKTFKIEPKKVNINSLCNEYDPLLPFLFALSETPMSSGNRLLIYKKAKEKNINRVIREGMTRYNDYISDSLEFESISKPKNKPTKNLLITQREELLDYVNNLVTSFF